MLINLWLFVNQKIKPIDEQYRSPSGKKTVDERHFYYHEWTVELRADLGGLDTMTINDAYLAVH